MELKYQCSKCTDYKFENEFSKNRCNAKGINYICEKSYNNRVKSNDKNIICECGSEISKSSIYKHRKTFKHIIFVNNNEII
jgi:hypothetical protein